MTLPPGPFDLIYCDPPLHFNTWSRKGDRRSPQHHYRCMSVAELLNLPAGLQAGDPDTAGG